MIKQTLFLTAALTLSLAACTAADDSVTSDGSKIDSAGLKSIEIAATYAFETRSDVAMLATSPNDVASWLGAVGVLGTDGQLRFSDIEAVSTKPVSGNYSMVIGFDRAKAPALFAAINPNGTWRGFVESSNTFDFSPVAIVGAPPGDTMICQPFGAATTTLSALSPEGLVTYSATISDDGVLTLNAGEPSAIKVKDPASCLAAPDGSVIVSEPDKTIRFGSDGTAIRVSRIRYSSLATLVDEVLLGVYDTNLYAIDAATLEPIKKLSIEAGMSIQGAESIGKVFVTPSPFGGTAFNEGAVFLTDADKDRVVVISRGYFLRQLRVADQ